MADVYKMADGKDYVIDPASQQTVTTFDNWKGLLPRLSGWYLLTTYDANGAIRLPEEEAKKKGQLASGAFPLFFGDGKVTGSGGKGSISLEEAINEGGELLGDGKDFKGKVVKAVFDKLVPATPATTTTPPAAGGIPTIALVLGGAVVLYLLTRKKD